MLIYILSHIFIQLQLPMSCDVEENVWLFLQDFLIHNPVLLKNNYFNKNSVLPWPCINECGKCMDY